MSWKRMFSFRAAAGQDRTPGPPSDAKRSTRANAVAAQGARTSATTASGATNVRSRERSFSEASASRHDGSSAATPLSASSTNESASRRRSLELSSPALEQPSVRASCSAESLLEFNHPDDSESTLSLSLSCRSLHGDERPRTPVAIGASSKSADMLPRPNAKTKPRRHVKTGFPYFVTPLVLTTANPYVMPPTPPSSPTNTKPDTTSSLPPKTVVGTLPRVSAPLVPEGPLETHQHPSQDGIDEPPSAPTTIFQKITGAPRKRLVSRPSADGLALASSSSALTPFPSPRPLPLFDDRPTSSYGSEAVRVSRPHTSAGTGAAPRSNAGPEERVKIAATQKARPPGEGREALDVDEVLPRSQMPRS